MIARNFACCASEKLAWHSLRILAFRSLRVRILLLSIVCGLLLGGCVGRTIRSTMHGSMTTQFISNPPGARIEVNGDYVGNAPLSYTWPWKYRDARTFSTKLQSERCRQDQDSSRKENFLIAAGIYRQSLPAFILTCMRRRLHRGRTSTISVGFNCREIQAGRTVRIRSIWRRLR
ncbi:MAG: hypothetical protein QOC70_1748 [Verrucomicrobiota bacterium]|jgi:hypothetical protein